MMWLVLVLDGVSIFSVCFGLLEKWLVVIVWDKVLLDVLLIVLVVVEKVELVKIGMVWEFEMELVEVNLIFMVKFCQYSGIVCV